MITALSLTCDTWPRYTKSTSSRTQLRELPYCYNYTRYGTEIHQEYQQSNTVTRTTVLLQLHTIRDRDTPRVPAVAHSYENYRTVTITHDTGPRYTRSTSSRTQLRELPYCYNYTRYGTEIHQEYQQSHTVTRTTVLLQLHTIQDRDTPGVPAVEHSYENYRTVTITHDTGPRYTRSTSSRTQLRELPYCYNYTRYRTEIHQEYQQSHTVTRITVLLQLHTIRDRDTPGVPAVEHSYENYRTVTITHDTGLRYTRSTRRT